MPAIDLGVTYSNRAPALTPEVILTNLVLEKSLPNQVDQKSWITRPGFTHLYDAPGGLRGAQNLPIGFGGPPFDHFGFFHVSGGTLYYQPFDFTAATALGTVAGTDYVTFAATTGVILVCGGGSAYIYNGTFTPVAMPDDIAVGWVAYMAGYFLLGQYQSQHIFFMVPSATAPDALDFFSAEVAGDYQLRAIPLGDQLAIFGEKHTEFWQPSGDANLPFNRIIGQLYSKGIASVQGLAVLDNSIYFVGNDRAVYRADAQPVDVGDPTISQALADANLDTLICWSFVMDNHAYFVMTVDQDNSFVLDVSTGSWMIWATSGARAWQIEYGFQFPDSRVYGGSQAATEIYQIETTASGDDGGNIVSTLVGGVPVIGRPQRCDSVTLIIDAGGSPSDIDVALSFSDDQGQTYSAPDAQTVTMGNYTDNPVWRMLGLMQQPGRVFKFTCSHLGPFRISTARYNESFDL